MDDYRSTILLSRAFSPVAKFRGVARGTILKSMQRRKARCTPFLRTVLIRHFAVSLIIQFEIIFKYLLISTWHR